jgi:hypothetical protein
MKFRRRRTRSLESMRAERAQLVAQLEAAREQAAWESAGDNRAEAADGKIWSRQAAALQRALDELDVEILRTELDAL